MIERDNEEFANGIVDLVSLLVVGNKMDERILNNLRPSIVEVISNILDEGETMLTIKEIYERGPKKVIVKEDSGFNIPLKVDKYQYIYDSSLILFIKGIVSYYTVEIDNKGTYEVKDEAKNVIRKGEFSELEFEFESNPTSEKTEPAILKYFSYKHLPEHLQEVSKPFGELAEMIAQKLPNGPEQSVALRKLLEAKDAAVRAKLG